MNKIREIIRLHDKCNLTRRAISRALNISRPVVKKYIESIDSAGLNYQAVSTMDDDTLLFKLEDLIKPTSARYAALSKNFTYYATELKRTGVTLDLLWQEYRQKYPDGYSYSQFCYHYQVWRNGSALSMHMTHKAGDKMFVDFTGKKLQIVDKHSGEIQDVEVFIAILGASQHTYVEATVSQKKHDWLKVNSNALEFFGGVPAAIVPDCLKTAITKSHKYEPDINPEYADFACYYDTTILPARPLHPKDKALVEGAVKIVYTRIFAVLRDRIFYSLRELNIAIREALKDHNTRPMQKLNMSRQQMFTQVEKEALHPLPAQKYEIKHFKSLKAQFNYHIYLSDDKHHYSLPFRYRGKQMLVSYTDSIVEIFYKNRRIAFHKRDRSPNGYSTIKDHMPTAHRKYSDWNPERFLRWAQNIGNHTEDVITTTLKSRQHPEQSYKTCLGILNLGKKYEKSRIENACKTALYFNHCSYKTIKKILDNDMDNYQPDLFCPQPEHDNIRGNRYYN
ncbi:MAG: IS21 family transposase [Kosmotogaceae bacterium]